MLDLLIVLLYAELFYCFYFHFKKIALFIELKQIFSEIVINNEMTHYQFTFWTLVFLSVHTYGITHKCIASEYQSLCNVILHILSIPMCFSCCCCFILFDVVPLCQCFWKNRSFNWYWMSPLRAQAWSIDLPAIGSFSTHLSHIRKYSKKIYELE